MRSAVKRIALIALLPLLLSLFSCSGESHPLSHLSEPLSFTAEIPFNGEVLTCEVSLAEAAGDTRDGSVRILSPSPLSGVLFQIKNGDASVSCGAHVLPLSSTEGTPLAYLDLLSIRLPLTQTRREKGETVFVFSKGETSHTVFVRNGEQLPYRITLDSADFSRTMEILP